MDHTHDISLKGYFGAKDLPLLSIQNTEPAGLGTVQKKNLRLYRFYNAYRVTLGLVLIFIALIPAQSDLFSNIGLGKTLLFCFTYTALPLWDLLITRRQPPPHKIFISTCLDIMLLSVLLMLGEVSDNSLTNLLFIPIALGNVLIQGRTSILLAAIATLCLLSIHYRQEFSSEVHEQLDAGMKGFLFFCWALMIQSYNFRLKDSELLANLNKSQVVDLQKLSHSIMQHMRTGILVLKEPDEVVMMNEAAAEALASPSPYGSLENISPILKQAYWQWQHNPALKVDSFRVNQHAPEVQPEFTCLGFQSSSYVLIFLENKALLTQQAQKLKLASLGQLTASIAHEIRNPLGAISHSAQLLSESDELTMGDARLLDIINNHCHRINGIIETILQISRRDDWHPEIIDLNNWLVNYIHKEHFTGFPEPVITFLSDQKALPTRFDGQHLCQVVTNLCLNGMRYSQLKTGVPSLTLTTGITQSGYPWLEITDQGKGIPENQQDKVFDPFFTTDNQGTGLGLYLSRELCEINQASLELLASNENKGCTFRISFAQPEKKTVCSFASQPPASQS